MNAEVNYAGINRRVVAFFVDQIIFLVFYLFILFLLSGKLPADIFNYDDVYADSLISSRYDVLEELISTALYVALEALMIFKLGWTPGKLLCGIYIKDAGTLKNITLMQAVIRSTLKELLFVPLYISEWFMILPVLVLILAVFDRHKQCFYDKITKTVVVLKECDTNLNYMGITRRAIAHIIDCFIIVGICLIFSFLQKRF
ncbi:RDD family protein [Wolbachia endosymbiont of Ctenocephalides felis wCfeT]|uniref:RDD family protein n=1 Tax=Wolbachia endosymbiont of Ctenocephalides felis wCfeT TaxID=2732593 RepID=UPI001FEB369B|nr:RDD family protein [Wolbachia endosymbiont of Ctenocephalides felis wCfeT]